MDVRPRTPLALGRLGVFAIDDERIIISHDTDFGALLAFRRVSAPSFILIRSSDPLTPDEQAKLDTVAAHLAAGAIAVFARGHLRGRRLPIR
jgi:predicted nuclease of predicted toxin-antitoxin system